MATAGLWMLLALAALMVATGLPSWLLLLGVSMAFAAFGVAAGVVPLSLLEGLPLRLIGLLDNDLLQALPLYVLLGALLNRLPLADTLFRVASGGLARTGAGAPLAGLSLGVLLAPMNGSVGASVALLARSVLPRMTAGGVSLPRSAALVAAASTLGVVVPPSLVLILLGDAMMRAHTEAVNITRESVRIINTQDVFRGALVPAGLVLLLTAAVAWWSSRHRGDASQVDAPSLQGREIATAVIAACSIVVLLAGVAAGYLYAVEAAATGGVALFVYAATSGTLTRASLAQVLRDTMALTGALFALLVGATVFTFVLRMFGTDRWVADQVAGLAGDATWVLLLALGVIAASAVVLDAFEMIFVVVPIVMPPLLVRVPDAAWVAVLTLLILQASFLLPPLGYAVLLVRHAVGPGLALRALARALLPYLIVQWLVLGLVLTIPQMLLRGAPLVEAKAGQRTPALTDEQMGDLMRQQLDEQQRQGESEKK